MTDTSDLRSQDLRLIAVPALAERLGVTERFIRRLVAEDRVPFLKIGKFVRFDPREIEEWVDECRRQPTASLR
jgi:excisionase family DNA binding protein